jgi:cell division septum initiation protein DivIVA/DNA-binding XRE family transcriptional regulator
MAVGNGVPPTGDELRQARREAGLTQAELAQRLDVRLRLVDEWESGARKIPAERRKELEAATGRSFVKARPAELRPPKAPSTIPVVDDVMPIEPELPKALRGYEPTAVHARLDKLAAERERLKAETKDAQASIEALKAEREALAKELQEVQTLLDGLRAEHEQLRREAEEEASRLAAVSAQRDRLATETNETQALLKMRTAERERLQTELDAAREQVAQLEPKAQAEARGERARLIEDSILTAQRAANEVRQNARRSAAEIIRNARRRAAQIVTDAEQQRTQLLEEIGRLEQHAQTSRASLDEFLSSLLDRVRPAAEPATPEEPEAQA